MDMQKIKQAWKDWNGTTPTEPILPEPKNVQTSASPEELDNFLALSLNTHTDEYLQRLAICALESAENAAISKQLTRQCKKLEQHDRSLAQHSNVLAVTVKQMKKQLKQIESQLHSQADETSSTGSTGRKHQDVLNRMIRTWKDH